MIRDITGWVHNGMWSYCPEYPSAEITQLPQPGFLPEDFTVFMQRFVLTGQSGTYIETSSHADASAPPVSELPLDRFYSPLVIIDAGDKHALASITVADLEPALPDIHPGDAVLIRTGWDAKWKDPDFVQNSPFIEADAALLLFDAGPGLLGSDFPRFDNPDLMQFPWDEFWERVGLILAPVTNLSGLSGRCGHLICLPLKIEGACATPCRAAIIRPPERT